MVNTLPLFFYPSTWVYVDDDCTLLKSLAFALEEHNNVKLFQSPKAFIDFLHAYQLPLSEYNFLTSQTADESYGFLQHTPIDFDVTMLTNLADNKNRHNEITTMIVDYSMPEMDGFTLIKECDHFAIKKILLTGKAQENQAIAGFNNNLIHRFIQKGGEDMEETLITYSKELSFQYFQSITAPLLANLETENLLPLSDPVFVEFFTRYCEQHQISEYYLVDKQGSFLCIDKKGNRSCLVVQTDRSMESWLLSYSAESELSESELNAIHQRIKIPFFGVGKEAWQMDSIQWKEYFYTANVLEGRERYFWTIVNFNT